MRAERERGGEIFKREIEKGEREREEGIEREREKGRRRERDRRTDREEDQGVGVGQHFEQEHATPHHSCTVYHRHLHCDRMVLVRERERDREREREGGERESLSWSPAL